MRHKTSNEEKCRRHECVDLLTSETAKITNYCFRYRKGVSTITDCSVWKHNIENTKQGENNEESN